MRVPRSWLPGWLGAYRRSDARHDAVAGLVVGAILVPAGMGYAQAAGLPPVYGLYASMAPLIAYAVFGPSRVLILAPDSSLVPLVAAAVVPLAANPDERPALAAMLAVFAGVLCMAGAVLRLGFLAELVSLPVRYGFLAGIAVTVIADQALPLLGISADAEDLTDSVRELATAFRDRSVDGTTAATGLTVLTVVLLLRRLAPRVPAFLVGLVGAILAGALADLDERGVPMVGAIPRGLPLPQWPSAAAADLAELLAGAVGIAIVAFADTSVLSKAVAARVDQRVDANRELFALGAANVTTGLFQGFPVSASATRTPVALSAGARTQLAGVVGALVLVVILVAIPDVFVHLPVAALSAMVIAAAVGLVELGPLVALARSRPAELALAGVAFAAVLVLGPIVGVLVAIAVSLLTFVAKAWRPHTATLVRVEGLKGYHDGARHPEGESIPGLVLYRFDAPLFFANAEVFRGEVLALVAEPQCRWLVVTAEPITDIDATAAEMMTSLLGDLQQRGVTLVFAELKGQVRDQLDRYGLVDRVGRDRFYPTIGQAVHGYVDATAADWVDWEDRPPPRQL